MASCVSGCSQVVRFYHKLNRLKTLEDDVMATSLKRCLSTVDLALLGVGGMVGSGLYVLTGTVAKDTAGPAVVVSFIIAGIASLMAALCYAEFGARVPKTGSAYMFTYVSVGEIWAFLIGWNVILEYMIGGAAVARAWSGYLDSIFNHRIQNFTESHVMRWNVPFLAHYPDLLAASILILASFLISFGVRVSSWLNHIFSAISMVVIAFILVFGFILADPANWSTREGGFAPFGFSGIMAGTATCFYAFVGFDVIAASSEEASNPQKAIPAATAISLGLAATAYILVSTVLTLMVPWHTLDPNSALSDAFFRRGYSWAGFIVAVGSICAMNTVLLSNLFSLPRIVYAMAEDGLFFSVFSRVNPITKVPVIAILVFGSLMAVLALIFDLEALVQFLSIGTLLAYTFVAASIIVLRFQPDKRSGSSGGGGVKTDASSPPSLNQSEQQVDPSPVAGESHTFAQDSGELKEYESFSDKLQLVERQKAVKERRAPGTLKARWEPYLGRLLGDCEPGEVVTFCVMALMVSGVSLSAVLVFGNNQLHLPVWSITLLLVIFSLVFVLSLFLIWVHEQQANLKTFQVPLVPFIPGFSILLNVLLMLKLSPLTWIRFIIWLAAGLLVYFGYGIWHSKEGLREQQGQDVSARYVVLPSGSLVETVQNVQPEGQTHNRLTPDNTPDNR
ncbi:cationic amino acid transporter 4 [Triplophysa dalaica]|uniref:cationic amino acid transporter 4 n=1 Tax=Triplophysa dalaica TaxID=1582913 RepID=UPI0024DFD62C|nr:cationic amino acid transporter 4 [Triplophysa dalaica]XP_056585484.1 cationic amino acid transporter 4 [Triplophysa dalaica]XP_056585485.1 cationic amino acid transporter 4 [Triplophysa dalaica]XP_056585486.1 cationic amino acid transporter 4 [Triplophysa dalaica]XP_056585487.1 cationic amino acid transporter 4 [Triplophysa dalaica]